MFTRLINMHKRYQFYMTGFIESFEDSQQLEELRRKLGMKYAKADTNCKIWAFIDEIVEYEIVRDEEKMINFKLQNQALGIEGSKYTWWNSRTDTVFSRDWTRVVSNDRLITIFLILEVEHVVRNESDHTSLEIITLEEVIKVHESQIEVDPSRANKEKLYEAQSELKKQLFREKEF
ncbi:hypothetical protein H5410_020659 [Solanum commersonii]|uniref:Uncharacterized protein n=1 Tax=Solanum commersonii TaxID=4109 RepID=A0A9J5Z9Q7_SOLCO|nr:hypothetical protein H5410_020659 [Solanum commersonii]